MLEYDEAVDAAGGSHENQEYKYQERIGGYHMTHAKTGQLIAHYCI